MTQNEHTVFQTNGTTPENELRPLSTVRRPEIVCCALAVICFINILPNGFTNDDNPVIRYNYKITEPNGWDDIWLTDYWSESGTSMPNRDLLYRPVALTFYRAVYILAGTNAVPYHICCLALHAIVTWLVIRFARLLADGNAVPLVSGLLFAVMPIHVEVVASIVGIGDMLAAGGCLCAVFAHLRTLRCSTIYATIGWRVIVAVCAFAAMGAKESGVAVLAVVPLFDLYSRLERKSRDRITVESCSPSFPLAILQTARNCLYLFLPLIAYFGLRYHALGGQLHQRPAISKTVNLLVDAPLWQHILGVIQLWGMYWTKTIWPAVLTTAYAPNDTRLATSIMNPYVLLGLTIAAGLIGWSIVAWRKGDRRIALLTAVLLVCYAPTANAFVLIQVFMAERIWYLPSFTIALLAGLALRSVSNHQLARIALAIVCIAAVGRCWVRNTEWRNNGTLYASAYRDNPDTATAQLLFGQWLSNAGRHEEAIEVLNRAVQIDLGYTDAHRELGLAYMRAGIHDGALHHLSIAQMQIPGHPPVEQALEEVRGLLVASSHERLFALKKRADASPEDLEKELAVIQLLHELALFDEAIARLALRESQFEDSLTFQAEYAVTLNFAGRSDEAIKRYRQCVAMAPDNPQLLVELAMLLMERRREDDFDEARSLCAQAIKTAPNDWRVLVCHAEILYLQGDTTSAIRAYRKAIDSLPEDAPQRNSIKQRAKALGG